MFIEDGLNLRDARELRTEIHRVLIDAIAQLEDEARGTIEVTLQPAMVGLEPRELFSSVHCVERDDRHNSAVTAG